MRVLLKAASNDSTGVARFQNAIARVELIGGFRLGADAPKITARFRDPAGNVIGLYQQPA
jgi:hypothetical protein